MWLKSKFLVRRVLNWLSAPVHYIVLDQLFGFLLFITTHKPFFWSLLRLSCKNWCVTVCLLLCTYVVSVGDGCDARRTFENEDDEHEDQVLLNNVSLNFCKYIYIIKSQSFLFELCHWNIPTAWVTVSFSEPHRCQRWQCRSRQSQWR